MTDGRPTHTNGSNTSAPTVAVQLGVTNGTLLMRSVVAGICVSSLVFQMGCYNTIPITSDTAHPVGAVVITVNDRGRTQLGPRFGGFLDHMTAHITSADANEVKVTVADATDVKDHKVLWADEPVTILRDGISSIQQKQLSKKKSWLLAGLIAVGSGLIFALVGKNAGNSPSDGKGDPPPI